MRAYVCVKCSVILTRECATRPAIRTCVRTDDPCAYQKYFSWDLLALRPCCLSCLYFCSGVRVFKLDIYYRLFIDTTVCTSQHRNSQLRVLFDGCCTCQFMSHLAVASWAVVWVQKALKLKCIMVLVHVFGQVFFLWYRQ